MVCTRSIVRVIFIKYTSEVQYFMLPSSEIRVILIIHIVVILTYHYMINTILIDQGNFNPRYYDDLF